MKTRKSIMVAMAVMLVMTWASFAFGAASPEEAAKLGTTLTGVGAEMAGNKEGTIPPYTGGLTKPPANYVPGSGRYPDPFAAEKPLFSINAQNMAQYADKLSEGTMALMKRYSTFRVDVYKTHRTVAYPDDVIKNTAKIALKAKTANNGLSLRDARAGFPFPIPKDGYEAMWNHLVRFMGRATDTKVTGYLVDASGRRALCQECLEWDEFPYYDEDTTRSDANYFWKAKVFWSGPPRKAGEVAMLMDPINIGEKSRIVYQYLPGQRRVKLAPEIAFDTPNSGTAGNNTYDEVWQFNGSMERYNFKIVGKKELYIPYNAYKAVYWAKKEDLFGPRHLNPDLVRWELHRVWVVEGNLKPDKRHIYHKRLLYIDEDTWNALVGENFDAHGNLFKVNYNFQAPSYDIPAPWAFFLTSYNMVSGSYVSDLWPGEGFVRYVKPHPEKDWTPGSLAGSGVR
jgi:hypothetical protein